MNLATLVQKLWNPLGADSTREFGY
jgi:hypothetical protein